MDEPEGRAKGGIARAEILPPERRKEIAKEAARARWMGDLPVAVYGSSDRPLRIGNLAIPCYVLDDERRVITQMGMLAALGISQGGRGKASGQGDRLGRFLTGDSLSSFVVGDLLDKIQEPLRFRIKVEGAGMRRALGYEATTLPDICEAVLSARGAGALTHRQIHVGERCELLVRGFARVGIIALVDEATGYEKDRARDTLADILEQFIAKELQPYIRLFPSAFYENLFRLRGLDFQRDSGKKPQYFGHLTNDIVYARLAPGVLDELRRVVPRRETGRGRKYPFTRRLTEEIGNPKLREHLASVTTIMKLSDEYDDFQGKLDRIHPRYDQTLPLPLEDKTGKPL